MSDFPVPIQQKQAFRRAGRFAIAVAALLTAGASQAADDPISATQRALQKHGFYVNEPTGALEAPTRDALRRFQIRNGLKVSGEIDSETLQALQKPPAATAAAPAPVSETDEPELSARERSQSLVQSDREFLERIEQMEEAPSPEPPERTEPVPALISPSTPPAAARKPAPQPPASRPDSAPPAPRAVVKSESQDSPPAGAMTAKEAQQFVESYLRAAQADTPARELAFFADSVDYFNQGKVNREFIERDQRSYYKRWPSRNFELTGAPEVLRSTGSQATVRFRTRYALSGGGRKASGRVENILRLRGGDSGWKIAAIAERKIQ